MGAGFQGVNDSFLPPQGGRGGGIEHLANLGGEGVRGIWLLQEGSVGGELRLAADGALGVARDEDELGGR